MAELSTSLLVFDGSPVGIKSAKDELVCNADPERQARMLCAVLFTSVPTGVARKFAEITGADPQKVFGTGMEALAYDLKRDTHRRLSEKEVRSIKRALLDLGEEDDLQELAEAYEVTRKTIYLIREEKIHADIRI